MQLARAGFDLHEAQDAKRGFSIVATPAQAAKLAAKGATVRPLSKAASAPNARAAQAEPPLDPTHGYDVFRPWSLTPAPCPTTCATRSSRSSGIYEQLPRQHATSSARCLRQVAARPGSGRLPDHPRRHAVQGRRKPVVLYHCTQHAREWIAAEINRRLFKYFLDHKSDAGIRHPADPALRPRSGSCRSSTPTATTTRSSPQDTRFWRKTLRDNNGDGQITVGDGVDPNRNWPTKWRFDPEGASDNPASETYRGPRARAPSPRSPPTGT